MALSLPTPGVGDVWGAINNANLTYLDGAIAAKADTANVYSKTAADARYVRTINGNVPDGSGNVVVAGGGTVTASSITDSSTIGRTVLTASDATSARSAIGAGTSSLVIGGTATTAKAGNYTPLVDEISDAGVSGRALMKAATAAVAKTALGLDQATNTSDANKPVSTATAAALATKQPLLKTYASQAAAASAATGGAFANGELLVVTGP